MIKQLPATTNDPTRAGPAKIGQSIAIPTDLLPGGRESRRGREEEREVR